MGIRDIDNRRTADPKEFMSIDEKLVKEVIELKNDLNQTIENKDSHSNQLVEETHTEYESRLVVLQNAING